MLSPGIITLGDTGGGHDGNGNTSGPENTSGPNFIGNRVGRQRQGGPTQRSTVVAKVLMQSLEKQF